MQHIRHKGKALLDSYPPKYWVMVPPNTHPKVGAVMETIENTVLTNF